MLIPAYWSQVEAGQTVIARDGQPRLITRRIIHDADPRAIVQLEVFTSRGERQLIDPRQPVLIMAASHTEAIMNILTAFSGSSIVSDRPA